VTGGIWGCVESLLDYRLPSLSQPWPFRNSRFFQPFPLEPSVLSSSGHNKVEGLRYHSSRSPVDVSSHSVHTVVCILLLLPIHGVTESLSQRLFPPFPCSKITSLLPFSVMDKKRRQRHRLWHFSPLPPFPILWTIIFSFLSYVSVSRRTKLASWLMTINNFIYTDPWCPHLWSEAMKVVDLSVMIKSAWVCHMWGTCELNSAF